MDNLIYRQAALDMVNHLTEIYVNNLPPMLNKADVDNNLRLLPSADVQPLRHGHWIDETFKPTGLVFHPYVCDQCGCHSESNFTYCPDCGARMDGEQNDRT